MSTRASALDSKARCGRAPSLDVGAGRAAAMSTAFHALCNDPAADDTRQKLGRLTSAERKAIESWHKPTSLDIPDGTVLRYSEAEREFPLAVKRDWTPCDEHDPDAWLTGHPDMVWFRNDLLVVGDLKKTRFTAPAPGESLQTLSYVAMALACRARAGRLTARAYVAHWYLEDGEWDLSNAISIFSLQGAEMHERVEQAANNTSDEYSTGPHCSGCWSRLRCPAHMVQIDAERIAVPGLPTDEVTDEDVARLIVAQKQLADTAEAIAAFAKDYVRARGLPIVYQGKQWGPSSRAGRKSLDRAALEAELASRGAPPVSEFEVKGEPYEVFQWKKA